MAIDLNKNHYNEGEKIRTVTPENPAEEIYPGRNNAEAKTAGSYPSGQIPAPGAGNVNAPSGTAGGQGVNSAEMIGKELESFGKKIGSAVEDLINNLGDTAAAARAAQQAQQNQAAQNYQQPQQNYQQPQNYQGQGYQAPPQNYQAQPNYQQAQTAVQTEQMPQRDMRHFEVNDANQYPAPAGNGGFVTGVPAAPTKKKKKKNIALRVIVACIALTVISNVGNGIAERVRDNIPDTGIVAVSEEGHSGSFTIPMSGINDLKIASGNTKIKLVPTDGDSFKITYKLSKKQELLHSENGGTLDIYTDGNTGFNIFGGGDEMITVSVPSGYKGNISATGSNGSVNMSDISTDGSVVCKSDNGEVYLENVSSSSAELTSGNGRVEMERVNVTGKVKASSNNGKIIADSCTYASGAELSSQNGRIEINHSNFSGNSTIQSDNGRCVFDGCSLENADIRSKNGSIKGSLKGSESDYSIEVNTKNGSSNLSNRTGGKYTLKLSSDNGSISLDFE